MKKIDTDHPEEFLKCGESADCLGFYRIIKKVAYAIGCTTIGDVRRELMNAHHDRSKMSFDEFVAWMITKFLALKTGGAELTDREQALFLRDACDNDVAKLACPAAFSTSVTSDKYPTFLTMRQDISNGWIYHDTMEERRKNRDGKKRARRHHPGLPEGGSRRSQR
jgi:hypothetical protein